MPSKFIPLDEAAKALGMSVEALQSIRESGKIRGFRDGASWKFPADEIDRLIAEEALSEDSSDSDGDLFNLDADSSDKNGDMSIESEVSLMAGEGGSEGELRLVSSGGESGENIFFDHDSSSSQLIGEGEEDDDVDPASAGSGNPFIVDGGDSVDDLALDLDSESEGALFEGGASGASGDSLFAATSGADIADGEDDLALDLDSDSGRSVLGGGGEEDLDLRIDSEPGDAVLGGSLSEASEDDLELDLDSDSGRSVLGGAGEEDLDLHIDSEPGDAVLGGSLSEASEDDLELDLDSDSARSVLGGAGEEDLDLRIDSEPGAAVLGGNLSEASEDDASTSDANLDVGSSVDDILREIHEDSDTSMVSGDADSGELLADSESIGLGLQDSDEDLIAEISSQSDVSPAIDLQTPKSSPAAGEASPISEEMMDLASPDEKDSPAASPAESTSDGDLDLSMDLDLSEESKSDSLDLDLNLEDAPLSEPSDIDLAANLSPGPDSDLAIDNSPDELAEIPISSGSDPLSSLELADDGSPDLALPASPVGSDDLGELSSDNDDDLVISSDSSVMDGVDDDLGLGADDDDDLVLGDSDDSPFDNSGINLMSPADSGLALDSAPLNLSGSSVSGFDLGGDLSGSPISGDAAGVSSELLLGSSEAVSASGEALLGSGEDLAGISGSGEALLGSGEVLAGSGEVLAGSSGSVVDFQADEEFQLSPEGMGLESDDDSGSQVIDVEDSAALTEGMLAAGEAAGWAEEAVADAIDDEIGIATSAAIAPAAAVPTYEIPFSIWNVMSLAGISTMLASGGIIMTDLVRNLRTTDGESAAVSTLTAAILKALGMDA